jgi:predicted transcriptional regulator
MADEQLTTVQIDVDTREKLRELAQANMRSMTAQIRWIVNQEFATLQAQAAQNTPPQPE